MKTLAKQKTEPQTRNETDLMIRAATVECRAADGDKPAQVRMSVSSEEPVLTTAFINDRWQRAYEILDHTEGSVDLSRAQGGLVVLDRHYGDQVGLMAVELKDKKLAGPVEFCTGQRAQDISKDAAKGLRRNVSVGYTVRADSYRIVGDKDGIPVVRAMSWMPYEASFEPVPADTTVGVNRAAQTPAGKPAMKETRKMDPKDMAKLFARAAKYGVPADKVGELASAEGATVESVRAALDALIVDKQGADLDSARNEIVTLNERKPHAPAAPGTVVTPIVGLTPQEVRRFSFMNCVRSMLGDKVDVAFERECSDAVAKKIGKSARGFFVPYDVQIARRDLQITGGGTGSNVVATNLMAGDFITAMRNRMALPELGVTMMTGLAGDIAIPKGAAATAYWIAETAEPTESTPVLSQVTGSPNTVGATVDMSRKLLLQSSVDVEAYVRNEIAIALANAIDAAAFNGAGTSEPLGLLTGPISTDVSVTAGTPTYAEIVNMIATVTGKNVMFENIKWAVTNEVFWKLAATAISTNGPIFVADYLTSRIVGRPAVVSENVTANYGIVGDWSKMILAMWGNGLDLTVDPYTGSKSGLVSVTGFMDADILIKDANAFAHADICS